MKQMIESKLSPDVVTLNSVMKAYAMKGDVRSTEYWFDEMKRHRIQPDGFSYLEIMRAYAHCPESKKRRSHEEDAIRWAKEYLRSKSQWMNTFLPLLQRAIGDRHFQRFKEDYRKEIAEAESRGNRYQSD